MKVSELGEFGLIDLLAKIVADRGEVSEAWQRLYLGIGDDAAAWQGDTSLQLATTDTLVQDVHFVLDFTTWEQLGWKSLAVNLSDIAAMGGIPRYALVSLALPGDTEVENVAALYHGMTELAAKFGVAIAGGNISMAPLLVITLSVWGVARDETVLLTRSAAMPGDLIAVTGYLGASAGGLRMLSHGLKLESSIADYLKQAHLRPYPQVAEGQVMAQEGVKAAIDISDGLVADLGHVCKASKVGARLVVDHVPVHPKLKDAFKQEWLRLALAGGEDYELLFTGGPEVIARVKGKLSCSVTVIGEIVADERHQVSLIDEQGKSFSYEERGWEHFVSSLS